MFRHRPVYQQQAQQIYIPCAPGCRGSESDPRHCQCVCRGINHGCLVFDRPIQPIHVRDIPAGYRPDIPLLPEQPLALPAYREMNEEEKRAAIGKMPEVRLARGIKRGLRPIGRSFKQAITGRISEDELNETILNGLRKQFSMERANALISESFTEYQSRNPDGNRPELYELFESGFIDNTLDRHNMSWVIGRPKKIRNGR